MIWSNCHRRSLEDVVRCIIDDAHGASDCYSDGDGDTRSIGDADSMTTDDTAAATDLT
jgi:hypothetical protein